MSSVNRLWNRLRGRDVEYSAQRQKAREGRPGSSAATPQANTEPPPKQAAPSTSLVPFRVTDPPLLRPIVPPTSDMASRVSPATIGGTDNATAPVVTKAIPERYIQTDKGCEGVSATPQDHRVNIGSGNQFNSAGSTQTNNTGRGYQIINPIFHGPAHFENQNDPDRSEKKKDAAPQHHWVVPFGRNKGFVGRGEILSQLLERILPNADKDDCQRIAIEGLGGVGKTQIALEAAYRVRDEHPDCSIFWVPAVDATSFENAFRDIGKQLKIGGINEDKADVKLLVKTALSKENIGSWLLVIDNADDIELLFGTTRLLDYLPFSRKGSILFTTRNHKAAVGLDIPRRNIIAIAEMDGHEALELLQNKLGESQIRDTESTKRLLDFLANLPLAIRQASAYIAETGISTTKYLQHCQSSDKTLIKLLSEGFEDRGRYKSIENAVATTWLISFTQISRDNRLAAQYLRFICFLAEKEIPRSLLPPADDEVEMDKAISTLKAYALIVQREEQESFDIHRLVRLAMRNWLEEQELKECVTSAIRQLDQAFPFPEHENRDVWMKYLPHAQAALEFRGHSRDKTAEAGLLHNIGWGHYMLGKYEIAEQIYRQTLELKEKVRGKEHPSTFASMDGLAITLMSLKKYKEAEWMHRRTLGLREKVLGKEHRSTLSSMMNLAVVLNDLGKYSEAEQMHRQTLELKEKMLGKEHSSTLASMNGLANVFDNLGKYSEAEQMHRRTLELYKKVLGKEHPDTLSCMESLAITLENLGEYEEAEKIYRQALDGCKTVLGKDHPSTRRCQNNLANCLRAKGEGKKMSRN